MIYYDLTSDQIGAILAAYKDNSGYYSDNRCGNKIAAIKVLRGFVGCGLSEGKDAVEWMLHEKYFHEKPDSVTARIREITKGMKLVGVTLNTQGVTVTIDSSSDIGLSFSLGKILIGAEDLREILRHYDNTRM